MTGMDDTVPAERANPAAGPGGDARADILHRIRSALADAAPSDIPRNYRTEDERDRDEIVNVFAERVAEYRATVHRVAESEVAEAVERIASEAGARRIGIPADLPEEWRPGGVGRPSERGRARARRGCLALGARARRARRRSHRLRARHRRGRGVRSRRRDGAGQAGAVARAGPSHLRRSGGSGRGTRSGGGRAARGVGQGRPAAHVRRRAVRDLRHRARPGRGRARPARAARQVVAA